MLAGTVEPEPAPSTHHPAASLLAAITAQHPRANEAENSSRIRSVPTL